MRIVNKLSLGEAGTATLSLLFFLLYFVFLWQVVDLRLIYHGGGLIFNFPVFYLGWEFFRQTISLPGGLVDYIIAFLAQFFYIGWAGALIATVQAWLIWVCIGSILQAAGQRRFRAVSYLAAILLLMLYARYVYTFGRAMSILTALLFVRLYMGAARKQGLMDFLLLPALSIILYIIAGGAFLLFSASCGIYEMLLRRRLLLTLTFVISAATAVYIISINVFNISVIDILNSFLPHHYRGDIPNAGNFAITYAFFLLLPLTLAGLWLSKLLLKVRFRSNNLKASATIPAKDKQKQSVFSRLIVWFKTRASAALAPSAAIVASILVVCFFHNSRIKALIAVDYYASNKMWSKVLENSTRYQSDQFINHAVNRALYHTGRFADDMFMYEQQPGALLMLSRSDRVSWWRGVDTCIDLGHANVAEFHLIFCMDTYGERPIFLKQRALVNMVTGNLGTAHVCLGMLSKTLFDAGWAREYLEKIEADPNLLRDKEVQQLRSMMPSIDRDSATLNESIFLDLLDKNKHNRMAFEYLMGIYLLTGQLDKFTGNLYRLDDFEYTRIPRAYEEAILLYNLTNKKNALPGREISSQSRARFDGFCNIYFGRYRGNKAAALNELARDYGDSYFFYSAYGRSGMKQ